MSKRVAIIGCGLIGEKRAKTLSSCQLLACADVIREKAEKLASKYPSCAVYTDWREMLKRSDIDIVIISTIHATLAEMTLHAITSGKHVLVEKPAARHVDELDQVIAAAEKSNVHVRVGFNHRYHRAFRKAREIIQAGDLGDLMFIRARYGHGGRPGYEKEWRAQPAISGGGELIDQGIHLIDLARWFLGDFSEIHGFTHTYYWNMPVEDNGFLILKTPKKQVAHLHASCTEWKNLFSFEIYGKRGKIDIHGLGGSYGVECITHYKMLASMGPPETMTFEFPMADDSWQVEWDEFLDDIQKHRKPSAGLMDAKEALKIVNEVYRMSQI